MPTRSELKEIYSHTSYNVHAPEGIIRLRVGEHSAALDELLQGRGAPVWAFITAWNPGSMRLPRAENERNNRDLLERLQRMGYEAIPGEGAGDDGSWEPEASFLVPGLPLDAALELGRFYRQMAVLVGTRGSVPKILWC